MLIDELDWKLSSRHAPVATRAFQENKFRARRYMFTDDVVTKIAELLRDYPDALLNNYQFALPPYPHLYMEYNIDLFLQTLGTRRPSGQIDGPGRDVQLGFLIANGHQAHVVCKAVDDPQVICTPVAYSLHNDHRMPNGMIDLPARNEADVASRMQHLFGTTLNNTNATWNPGRISDINARFRSWTERALVTEVRGDASKVQQILTGSAGELRTMLMMLLWINQPKLFVLSSRPASRQWVGNKKIAYAAHNVVHLNSTVTKRSLVQTFSERRGPRRHEVAAFWRNHNKTHCEHDWPLFPDEDGHFHCKKCPQWRVRVKQHERGDATIGFVTKHYEVNG